MRLKVTILLSLTSTYCNIAYSYRIVNIIYSCKLYNVCDDMAIYGYYDSVLWTGANFFYAIGSPNRRTKINLSKCVRYFYFENLNTPHIVRLCIQVMVYIHNINIIYIRINIMTTYTKILRQFLQNR